MSTYEHYSRASLRYDETRVAVGTEIVLGAIAAGPVPLAGAAVLDAACGTGSYAAVLAPRVGSLSMLDADEGMLSVARRKLTPFKGVDCRLGRLQELPFEDSSFDAVTTNQALHHLGDEEGGDWAEHAKVLAEYRRVLRPGGVLVVNTCSQDQLRRGYWYYALIPAAAESLRRRYAPLTVIEQQLAAHGLTVTGRFVPADAAIQGAAYLDGAGPLSASWRLGDSTWALATAEELEAMTETVSSLEARGELDAYVAEHDAAREAIGQITFVVARSPVG